ncbi:hypothetical protein V8E51_006886 [Hyaloscypha variabilis]
MSKHRKKIGEPSTRRKESVDEMDDLAYHSESEYTPNTSRHPSSKKAKSLKKSKKFNKQYKATIEDAFEGDEENREEPRQFQQRESIDQRTVLQDLERAATFLGTFSDSESLENWLQNQGSVSEENIQQIEESCGNIARLLRSRRAEDKKTPKTSRSLERFDEYFLFRDGTTRIMLLAPLEIFQANVAVSGKTFGFVREEKQYWPLMCAISGSKMCVKEHGKLLDNNFWGAQTFRFGIFHGHDFPTNGYEVHRGEKQGTDFASHVEPKLMLWFAWSLLRRISEKAHPIEKEIGMLYKLKRISNPIAAEIVISRAACPTCEKFQAVIEEITGLKFKIIVIPNLGTLPLEKNKYNQKKYPLVSNSKTAGVQPDSEEEDFEEEDQRSRIQVVIRQFPVISPTQDRQRQQLVRQQRTITVEQATHLQHFYHAPQTSDRPIRRQRNYFGSSDEEEWQPSTPIRSRPREDNTSNTSRTGLRTPPESGPFGSDAIERANSLKKKRKIYSEMETSPTAVKKGRSSKR